MEKNPFLTDTPSPFPCQSVRKKSCDIDRDKKMSGCGSNDFIPVTFFPLSESACVRCNSRREGRAACEQTWKKARGGLFV